MISDIQINEGPLGNREMIVKYGDVIKEYVIIDVAAGSPVTLNVSGWPDITKASAVSLL